MTSVENKHGIIPFRGNGFDNWKFRLQAVLKAMDLHEVLKDVPVDSKNEEWHKKNNKACMIIIQSVADSHLEYIKEINEAHEMISKLEGIFSKKGTCSKFYLLKELNNLKYACKDDIQEHFSKCDRIFRELKNLGSNFDESDMSCFLLLTMPVEFENVVTAIRTMSEKDLKIEFVKNRLLEFDINRHSTNTTKGEAPLSFNAAISNTKVKQIKCFKCGKLGHVKSVCGVKCFTCNKYGHKSKQCKLNKYENKDNRKQNSAASSCALDSTDLDQDSGLAFCAMSSQCRQDKTVWYADSGATHHYVNSEEVLLKKKIFPSPKIIHLAEEGKVMEATSTGDIKVLSMIGNRQVTITLKDVLCVPGLRVNLLSVSSIEKAGFEIIFSNSKMFVKKNNITYVEGERIGSLYKIVFMCMINLSANLASYNDIELWHKRYGHLNYTSLINNLKVVNGLNISNKKENKLCEICVLSKQKCLKYHSKTSRSTRVLELVHTDVCGPITPMSHNENNYFITFVDDFSRFVMIYAMKRKDAVINCFKDYESKVTAMFCNKRIAKIKCDNGGEYCSGSLKDFCREKGISISYTPPYTPQMNGVAERMNQTIMDKARSLIMQAGMDKMFWEDAVYMAAYITNRTQSYLVKDKTPYELWFDRKPNVSNMRVFGCIAYARVPDALRSKLDNKGVKCRFIGYTENGYRLWQEEENRLIHSRNVVFDENNFVYKSENMNSKDYDEEENLENGSNEQEVQEVHEEEEDSTNDINEERMLRPRREIRLPRKFDDYDIEISCLALLSEFADVPKSYTEALQSGSRDMWERAINDELNALIENKTWEIVERPEKEQIISNRWVFRKKENDQGKVVYKARLVARGFEQTHFGQISQIHAPVARLSTLRIFLSICNNFDLILEQFDVKNAFLNSDMTDEAFMNIPEGLKISKNDKNKVCLLRKAIYGLKQAPKLWNDKFNNFMINLGFKRSKSDYCLYSFVCQNVCCYLLIYVDDILIASNDFKFLDVLKSKLTTTFKVRRLSDNLNFLGIRISRDINEKIIKLDQILSIENLIKRFKLESCKSHKTPIEKNLNLKRNLDNNLNTKLPYKELLGSLMYIMMGTRPDICFSVGYFGRFQDCATDEHFKHLLRVLKYLKTTIDYKLCFEHSNNVFEGFADSDFANDAIDRKSVSGCCFKLFNNLISWTSKKQSIVTLSSTESEFVAICVASCELLYFKNLLEDLNVEITLPISLFEDNQSTIKLLHNFENNRRCKHIDVKLHFVLDLINQGVIEIKYLCTSQQLADVFTKALGHEKFYKFLGLLGLKD